MSGNQRLLPGLAPKRKGRTPETSAPVQRCIDRYAACFAHRHRGLVPDPRQYGRHGKALKVLVDTWGESTVNDLVTDFFASADHRIQVSDYSLREFLYQAQRLLVRRAGPTVPPDERMASNVGAARRAVRGGRL